jgi:hypothetical protein
VVAVDAEHVFRALVAHVLHDGLQFRVAAVGGEAALPEPPNNIKNLIAGPIYSFSNDHANMAFQLGDMDITLIISRINPYFISV